MICKECKGESSREDVCTNCGLVAIEKTIVNYPVRRLNTYLKSKEYANDYIHPLAPDIQYSHLYPKKAKNKNLSRAFKRQTRESKGSKHNYYVRAFTTIKKYASILNLPLMVRDEAINIYRCVVEKEKDFFIKCGVKPSYLAFIKLAAKIHEFPLNNRQFMELTDYQVKENRTKAYMDKKFNKAYMMAKSLLGLHFKVPKHPKYIDYVCETMKLPYECARGVHGAFTELIKKYKIQYKLEGYILALYYIAYKSRYNITLDKLEELFEVSRITIGKRRDELLKAMKDE